jgi:hypothetical protein
MDPKDDDMDPREPCAAPAPVEGAAFRNPSMPGTAAATLLKSAGLNLLLAKPNIAPAPPVACAGVTFNCFVS